MKKALYLFAVVLFLLASCSGRGNKASQEPSADSVVFEEEPAPAVPSTSYPYNILKKEISNRSVTDASLKKVHYTVEIPSEYSEQALDEIADVIAAKEVIPYVFVEYYMASQLKSGYNYGLSIRTPENNSTQINYVAPPKEEPASAAAAPYKGCKVYGKWNMDTMGTTVIAYRKGGKCYMVNFYGGSNYDDPERFIKTTYGGHTAFKNAEDPADMYVINANGDLEGYYEGDLACTFQRAD